MPLNSEWASIFSPRARVASPAASPPTTVAPTTAAPAVGSDLPELGLPSAPATGSKVDLSTAPTLTAGSDVASSGSGNGNKRPRLDKSPTPTGPPVLIHLCVCNMGSICPSTNMHLTKVANKAIATIGEHIRAADIVMFPEARVTAASRSRRRNVQLDVMRSLSGFDFEAADGGLGFAVYIRTCIKEQLKLEISFPSRKDDTSKRGLVLGSVAVVRGEGVALVGVYAPSMHVERDGKTGAGPKQREDFDTAFFRFLETVDAPEVALVGDFNLQWEDQAGGQHGAVRKRWKEALGRLGFGEPLDRPDASGNIVPTTWPATYDFAHSRIRSPFKGPARVDFLFVRQRAPARDAVADLGRHKMPTVCDDHMHRPLWLELNVRA